MIAIERRVELFEPRLCVRSTTADDDAVGLHEVGHRGTFLEKLGIRDHVEIDVGTAVFQRRCDGCADPVRGTHRHGGFIDHHLRRLHVLANAGGHCQDVLQICGTVCVGRCTDRDE